MPQAILLADVPELGAKGDVVVVSKGYMRNYLGPRKLAHEASDQVIEEARRRAEEDADEEAEDRTGREREGDGDDGTHDADGTDRVRQRRGGPVMRPGGPAR